MPPENRGVKRTLAMAADQKTDDDNTKAGDPNLAGSREFKKVDDRPAGLLSPSEEYDHKDPLWK